MVLHSTTGPRQSRHHTWIYRQTVLPIVALLRMGATPRTLAWSVALGLLIGINPILGSTTVLCLILSFVFRLNIVASQIANHVVFPLQLVLVIPFIRTAASLFHMPPMPLSPHALLLQGRAAPLSLSRQLWQWESRAFLLWMALSAVAAPILALTLTPILRRILTRVQRHEYPILER